MTLRDFVRDTLSQIVDGVADAKVKHPGIAPPVVPNPSGASIVTSENPPIRRAFPVEFDVAVVVTEASSKSGGGDVNVYVAKVEGKVASSAEQSTTSRIKFEVPVQY